MSNAIASKGVSLASIFDPYVTGTTKARASGIKDAGNDLSNLYASAIYGSAAAATGIKSQGADINTLYAAKGTASYALPIQGNTYTSGYNIPNGNTGWALIKFAITTGNTYAVTKSSSGSGAVTIVSGPVPAGASTVQYTWGTPTVDTNDGGGTPANGASSKTSVSSNPVASYQTNTFNATSGTNGRYYPFTIDFFSSTGVNISHTTVTLHAFVDGSV